MAEFPALPLFVDDYEAATAHLTLEEDGAYTRLLRLCWRQSDCSIPADDDWIMRRMRVDQAAYDRVVKPILLEFFTKSRARWFQKRLRGEHAYVRAKSDARSDAGRKGGLAKSAKTKAMKTSKATILPQQNGSKTVAPTPTPHPVEEVAAVVAREPEPEPARIEVVEPPKADFGHLLARVMAAVGLNPNDRCSAYWLPNIAEPHVQGWVASGIPEDVIVRIARESRQRHQSPPNGPRALDQAMQLWLNAQSAKPLTPIVPSDTGPSDARRPAGPSRLNRVLHGAVARAEARAAALDRGPSEDPAVQLLRPSRG